MSSFPARRVDAEDLLADLGPSRESTWRLLTTLHGALIHGRGAQEVDRCFEQWRELYCRASDWTAWSRSLGKTKQFISLCQSMGAAAEDPEAALFTVHTYYALVVKLICAVALGLDLTAGDRRVLLARLEDGSLQQELGVDDLVQGGECFAWYLRTMDGPLERELELLAARIGAYSPGKVEEPAWLGSLLEVRGPLRLPDDRGRALPAGLACPLSNDLFKPLYLALMPRQVRHRLGEYYTPDWLAERVLRLTMGRHLGDPRRSVLDPSCGSGTFLALAVERAVERARDEGLDDRRALELILHNVRGQDLNPLAVLAARATYLMALGPLIRARQGNLRIPVTLGDTVLAPPEREGGHPFVVGNPPWINWEHLPADHRQQTRALWQRHGLFLHRGMDTILGKGKKDICTLLTCVVLESCLTPGGRLGFVLPQGLLKTAGAAEGFRAFRLPGDVPFAPEVVEDFTALKPFKGASTRPVIAVFNRDQAVSYPVPYRIWKPGLEEALAWHAEPVDPARPTSAWLTARPAAIAALRRVLGSSDYTAHEGANTGGANGVYWVECVAGGLVPRVDQKGLVTVSNVIKGARKKVEQVVARVEAARLFPLLRGRDVGRWRAAPSLQIVMAQDPATRRGIAEEVMARDFPATAAYLARFEKMLAARPAFLRYFRPEQDAFWSMFNVGDYTFAPFKVVWREQASGFTAAVAGPLQHRAMVPDHKLMLVQAASADEAHYLCAALNSAPVRLAVAAYAVSIQMSTHVLRHVAVPAHVAGDATHRALADISRRAHRAAAADDGAALARAEAALDRRAGELWGLSAGELGEILAALEEM